VAAADRDAIGAKLQRPGPARLDVGPLDRGERQIAALQPHRDPLVVADEHLGLDQHPEEVAVRGRLQEPVGRVEIAERRQVAQVIEADRVDRVGHRHEAHHGMGGAGGTAKHRVKLRPAAGVEQWRAALRRQELQRCDIAEAGRHEIGGANLAAILRQIDGRLPGDRREKGGVLVAAALQTPPGLALEQPDHVRDGWRDQRVVGARQSRQNGGLEVGVGV
jgi:hypothetical protein